MSSVCVGTSGWGYPSWQPGFYPPGLDRSGFLSYYAERLATVELNATKYRLPAEEQFRAWAAQVPDGFLELLLGSIDPGIRYALDLRDPSWDGVEERLAEAGAVRVGDTTGRAGWAYIRYRELAYDDAELTRIAAGLGQLESAGIETYAFFRHGDAPHAPAAAVSVATACSLN